MKILLYFEGETLLKTSGIGRAQKHQMMALKTQNIEYTTESDEDFDILHINTYGINSIAMIQKAKLLNKPIIYHAHSTEEDFKDSFIFANKVSPIFKKHLVNMYSQANHIITPTPYAKNLLIDYGIKVDITDVSNGVDLDKYKYNEEKVKAFKKYFHLKENDKVIMCVGLYFERKGIQDFIEIAKRMPEYKFIWFGYTPPLLIPKTVSSLLSNYPNNLIFPGYVKGPIIEGAYLAADCFFFPSYEETEGIVVLEALASKQNVILRNIPVYKPWLEDKKTVYFGNNNEEFIQLIDDIVNKKIPSLTDNGYEVAKSKNIANIGVKLKAVYDAVYKDYYEKNSK